jgi:hypothetical protein
MKIKQGKENLIQELMEAGRAKRREKRHAKQSIH